MLNPPMLLFDIPHWAPIPAQNERFQINLLLALLASPIAYLRLPQRRYSEQLPVSSSYGADLRLPQRRYSVQPPTVDGGSQPSVAAGGHLCSEPPRVSVHNSDAYPRSQDLKLYSVADVFPTDARMKAKAKKLLDPESKPVKKKKIAEPGDDDCGEDHSAIMYIDEISYNSCDCCCFAGYKEEIDPDLEFELNYDCFMLNFEADLYPLHWLFGSGAGEKRYDSGIQTHFTSLASLNNTY